MIPIYKAAEPKSWKSLREGGASYGDASKDDLKTHLLNEQHELCAYCMCRISNKHGDAQVEHWQPQSHYPNEAMNYSNLLAVCNGKTGSVLHCDQSKGNYPLRFNPANPGHHPLLAISYSNGMIRSGDPKMDQDLNKVLNLNSTRLVQNRQAVAKVVKAYILTHVKEAELRKAKHAWLPETGHAKAYAGVALYLIEKKLRRYSIG